MQLQLHKRVSKHKLEGFRHITPTSVRSADIVAEISILKPTEKYLTQGNGADDCTIWYAAYQQADRIYPAAPLEEGRKLFWSYGRSDESTMQPAARAIERNEL